MRYLGGKFRIQKEIAEVINELKNKNQTYFEPFVGSCWIIQNIQGKRIASDGCVPLIAMYRKLQKGWIPPEEVSKEEYYFWKKSKRIFNPMKAFVGFGCSFKGKYYGGYARSNKKRNYCLNARNSLLKKLPLIKDVNFIFGNYQEHQPKDLFIYCDPPYKNTTNYNYFKQNFNHKLFWNTIRIWSKQNQVIVSEYQAPKDFHCIKEIKNNQRIEKLFILKN